MNKPKVIVLCGCSSIGKDTLFNKLISLNIGLKGTVSHTTRPRREGETNTYHFISNEEFNRMDKNGEFIEYRIYKTEFGDWKYALSKQALENNEGYSLVILDIQGLKQLEKAIGKDNVYSIFLTAPVSTLLTRSIIRQKVEIEREYDSTQDNDTLREILRRFYDDKIKFSYAKEVCDVTLTNETEEDLERNVEYIKNLIGEI